MGGHDDAPSSELLREARAGDASALQRLLRRYRFWLAAVARRWHPTKVAPKEGPSDLVQKCCLRAAKDFGRFQGRSARTFRNWLRGILANVRQGAIRYWTREQRDVGREQALPAGSSGEVKLKAGQVPVAEVLARQEDAAWLHRALAQLRPDDLELLQLRFFEDLTFEEIAAGRGTKPGTLRQQAARLLTRLREGIGLLKLLHRQRCLPLQEQALCLWHFQSCSQDSIAEQLQIPRSAVAHWIHEAKRSFPTATGDEP